MPAPARIVFCCCCWLLAIGCRSHYRALEPAPGRSADCVQRFRPVFSTFWYKTEVDVAGKRLSGLLLLKTMPDSSRRVVFTSEAGPTFFDFEFARDSFRVRYCMEKLNRKAVIRTLRKDFELLLMEPARLPPDPVLQDSALLYFPFTRRRETTYYITDTDCRTLQRIEYAVRGKQKVVIEVSPVQAGLPRIVRIMHRNFNFAIFLTALERNEARE